MIDTTLAWVPQINAKWNVGGRTLDVGSYDVNGCLRAFFSDYTGLDMKAGPNVDIVADACTMSQLFTPHSFDTVICMSVFEHVPNIDVILDEIGKVLKPHGFFYVSVPGFNMPRHNFPSDYYRFTAEAVREFILRDYDVLELHDFRTRRNKFQVIDALGRRR